MKDPSNNRKIPYDRYARCTVSGEHRPSHPGDQLRTNEVGLIHPAGYRNRRVERQAMGNPKKGPK